MTMMVLFVKGSGAGYTPWVVSALAALVLFELGAADYVILLLSVAAGIAAAVHKEFRQRA